MTDTLDGGGMRSQNACSSFDCDSAEMIYRSNDGTKRQLVESSLIATSENINLKPGDFPTCRLTAPVVLRASINTKKRVSSTTHTLNDPVAAINSNTAVPVFPAHSSSIPVHSPTCTTTDPQPGQPLSPSHPPVTQQDPIHAPPTPQLPSVFQPWLYTAPLKGGPGPPFKILGPPFHFQRGGLGPPFRNFEKNPKKFRASLKNYKNYFK